MFNFSLLCVTSACAMSSLYCFSYIWPPGRVFELNGGSINFNKRCPGGKEKLKRLYMVIVSLPTTLYRGN